MRIDDIVVEDITSAFFRSMMDWVDVKDFGAAGDGTTDDTAAFAAADNAANGRTVLVSEGVYKIVGSFTFDNHVRFEGTLNMADSDRLVLIKDYRLNSYIDAFGDEVQGFKKAFQALLNYTDHDSLDMEGRRIELDGPLDMQAIVSNQTSFEIRRILRNGQFNLISSTNWDDEVHSSSASYNENNPKKLTNVSNVANIVVGSLITGNGVGREVYVRSKNVGAGEIELSQELYGAASNQSYTFTRFQYALDFSSFVKVSKLNITDVEIQCNGFGSGVMLAPNGETFHLKDCFITKPKDRCVTSIGRGCQDLQIDRCRFASNEQSMPSQSRKSIVFNVNANDAKIRDSRFQRFRHTGILHGTGHMIVGNHWFQGDGYTDGNRQGGMIFTNVNVNSVITGNYIDNNNIELTNEHDAKPDFNNELSFGGLAVTGNIFVVSDVAPWFKWLVVKPYGSGHFLHGLSVSHNSFRTFAGNIDRIEAVDTSFADLDHSRARNVVFEGNTFNGVSQPTINPAALEFNQASAASTWNLNVGAYLPFGGNSRTVTSIVTKGTITNSSNSAVYHFPATGFNAGTNSDLVELKWPESCKGKVIITARMDRPV